ncbi:TIGR00180 family glycosyltransferase [Niabella yanshanensis]|uniref:TIGR00180 family glycosyltransferase n=1 Tax=Niabella yanshanensis TaxID=577386 RepID=A0ABZ0W245_9BACT|nr:TIGR00180 family glycosyltransferase [Niabella yanshanensis]WQD37338.1 TIGR00180 family glycosyltransferase [Niabella yanshanensis]
MDVTLVIILHNRHQNIRRLVEYYRHIEASVILADSSTQKHPSDAIPASWRHIYTPGINYTQKIEIILQVVKTEYVILCADDDFIIPQALEACISFLNSNPGYASVQGKSICYKKKEVVKKKEVDFYPLYPPKAYSYENQSGLDRIGALLANYKSFLYAVHRTTTLKDAYKNASESIRNLFLNEYNASIVPLAAGKYKELPVLFQVREYAEDSDDKTALTINKMFREPRFRSEIEDFLGHLLTAIQRYMPTEDPKKIMHTLGQGINNLVDSIDRNHNMKPSVKKMAGRFIASLPLLGARIIEKSRARDRQDKMSKIIVTRLELDQLDEIRSILKTH